MSFIAISKGNEIIIVLSIIMITGSMLIAVVKKQFPRKLREGEVR